jgi:hypothetical protein
VLVDIFSGMVCISYGCSPNDILAVGVARLKILAERRAMIKDRFVTNYRRSIRAISVFAFA